MRFAARSALSTRVRAPPSSCAQQLWSVRATQVLCLTMVRELPYPQSRQTAVIHRL